MKVVLTGDFPVYSTGDFEDTGFAWLQIEREARSLAEASPQRATSLTAGVRQVCICNNIIDEYKKGYSGKSRIALSLTISLIIKVTLLTITQ